MAERRSNYGRGSGGTAGYGRYRGRGDGGGSGGNYQSQYGSKGGDYYRGGGRGRGRDTEYVPRGRGSGYENRDIEYVSRGGASGGRRGGGGGGRGGNYENQYFQSQGGRGGEYYQGGGSGTGPDGEIHVGGYNNRPLVQRSHDGGPNYPMPPEQSHLSRAVEPAGRGAWTVRPWGPRSPSSPSSSTSQPQGVTLPQSQTQRVPELSPDPVKLDIQSLDISAQKSPSLQVESENKLVPVRRPDTETLAIRPVRLLANHFQVQFNPAATIIHYDVDFKQVASHGNQRLKRSLKSNLRLIREKLFSDDPERFPINMTAYDGEKNIYSAVQLPTGQFRVDLPEGEDGNGCSYIFTIKEVNQLKLSKLRDYICGTISCIPRDILQGMDLVMKDNPSKYRIPVGRSFYGKDYRREDDLGGGVAAYRGFQHSLKPTSQGLALCLDYSVLAFRKPLPVIDFLMENGFQGLNDVINLRQEVIRALQGLKVHVTHRNTKQKYTIAGLTEKSTRDVDFDLVDLEGRASPRKITVVDYFREKYNKEIVHQHIPCLDLGKPNKINYVPMEFCILVEGQIYPKENLDKDVAKLLKEISLARPVERKNTICEMVRAEDGPFGDVPKNFGIGVDENMTTVQGRVIGAPELKLSTQNGKPYPITVDPNKCHWNLLGKSVVVGKRVERWALIDFGRRGSAKLHADDFIYKLSLRCSKLGMHMEEPVFSYHTDMGAFSSVWTIRDLLKYVVNHPQANSKGRLQIIICVMADKHHGYKYLKWVSETGIGVVTQCCLSYHANRGQDQYLANLCLKINAKLGGSNVELNERLPHFVDEDYVMFIGADVNHPAARNTTCPSIAAVVGTVNWPAANRYVSRIQPQEHRKEKILNFGSICRDLINTYEVANKIKPKKIVVFRDGVSEGQFDMILNEELLDLKRAICDDHYQPTITLVVAQKRHQTRLFLETRKDEGTPANVPPGTVVDTTIVHPFEFDFYLCSHYGSIGTSKPTHYYVLWDENSFTSNELQKLIYHLCFTYARCTKPVSLVPPVYYADLVAYRGRMFQEVVMDLHSPAPSVSTSSANSSISSSSSGTSFQHEFYKLHSNLQNIMFFV